MIATRLLMLRNGNSEFKSLSEFLRRKKRRMAPGHAGMKLIGLTKSMPWMLGGSTLAQAIVLALQLIGAEIYSSSYHQSGNLFWDAPGKGYGFPVVPTYRDLLQGDDAKYL